MLQDVNMEGSMFQRQEAGPCDMVFVPGLGNTAAGISNVSLRTPKYVPAHITFHGKLSQGSTLTVYQPNYEAVRLKMNWSYHISFCFTNLKIIDPLRVITTGACSSGGSVVKNTPANTGDTGSIPGLERFPGEENGNPLPCACLENLMDRRVWWATVLGSQKSWIWLSD